LWSQCQRDAGASVFCKSPSVSSLSVSHDGAWLAVAAGGLGVAGWDIQTRRQVTNLPAKSPFMRVAFSPRGRLLAYSDGPDIGSSSTNYSVHVWDGTSGKTMG